MFLMTNLTEINKIKEKYKKIDKISEFLDMCYNNFKIETYSLSELSRHFKIEMLTLRHLFRARLMKKNRIDLTIKLNNNGGKLNE